MVDSSKPPIRQGKKSQYAFISGKLLPIDELPNEGSYLPSKVAETTGKTFRLPADGRIKRNNDKEYECTLRHVTNFEGIKGIITDGILKAFRLDQEAFYCAWFSLTPSNMIESPSPTRAIANESSWGNYCFKFTFDEIAAEYQAVNGGDEIVIRIHGTHVYQREIAYCLILCPKKIESLWAFPILGGGNCRGIVGKSEYNKITWKPYNVIGTGKAFWDHVCLGLYFPRQNQGIPIKMDLFKKNFRLCAINSSLNRSGETIKNNEAAPKLMQWYEDNYVESELLSLFEKIKRKRESLFKQLREKLCKDQNQEDKEEPTFENLSAFLEYMQMIAKHVKSLQSIVDELDEFNLEPPLTSFSGLAISKVASNE